MHQTESDMPGPSDAAKALQLKQRLAREAMYQARNDVRGDNPGFSYEDVHQHPRCQAAQQAYDSTVDELMTLLGHDVQCFLVDIDLWLEYSDWFKDSCGCRPFGARITREEIRQRFEGLAMAA
jgi:hypothetical protein